jgi:hypothetical protein
MKQADRKNRTEDIPESIWMYVGTKVDGTENQGEPGEDERPSERLRPDHGRLHISVLPI